MPVFLGFPGGSDGKESPYNGGDPGSIPGSGTHLEKGMATHSSILAWRIPGMAEPGGLPSVGLHRVVGIGRGCRRASQVVLIVKMQETQFNPCLALQSCLTLCDPIDGSPPGSAIPGILQARTLEWVAISFSNA